LGDALVRLSAAYTPEEEALFVRDVGFMFAGLAGRSQNPGWRGNRPYWSVGRLPGNIAVFLQPGSLDAGYYTNPDGSTDGDANVHHWAWAFAMGYDIGLRGIKINSLREHAQADIGVDIWDLSVTLTVDTSDVALGNAGVAMGNALSRSNQSYSDIPTLLGFLYNFDPSDWYLGYVE
jgi:hypothetical protein